MVAAGKGLGCVWKTLTRLGETRAVVLVAGLPEVARLRPRGERGERWRETERCVGAAELEEGGGKACRSWKSALELAQARKVRLRALGGGPASSSVPLLGAPERCPSLLFSLMLLSQGA